MAIFGKFEELSSLLSKTQELEYLESYIHSLFKSDFHSKTQSLKEGENFQTQLQYGMFAITHCYALKPHKEAFFESHQKYIDFQITLEGIERYLIGSRDDFVIKTAYDANKDLCIYDKKHEVSEIVLRPKELCIIFPQDVHSASIGSPQEVGKIVKKVIIKVPVSLIKHRL